MIRMIQLLCPNRHAIVAAFYNDETSGHCEVVAEMKAALDQAKANPWCGICGSAHLEFEDRPTDYQTIDEAKASAQAVAMVNAYSRSILDSAGLTFDKQRLN